MELNNFELEIILQAVRNERNNAEKNYIQALQTELNRPKYRDDECPVYGVSDSLTVLQRFNNLVIKLEDEIRNRNKSLF